MGGKVLDILRFSEILVGGKRVNIKGFWGVERGLLFKRFYSMPYTIPTDQVLEGGVFYAIRRRYIKGEIALRFKPDVEHMEFVSPVLRRGYVKYDRERRRLIKRAEERVERISFSKNEVDKVVRLCELTAKKRGRRIPKNIKKVLNLEGVDVISVYIGDLVGVIINLALKDRYLLWQMGWKDYNFLATFLLHISVERGFSLGYDIVDFGITTSERALKVKKELGCDFKNFVYVVGW
ncbi:MAG: hypothetical protein ABIL16_03910 [candidate division WOR-3 bacterium]